MRICLKVGTFFDGCYVTWIHPKTKLETKTSHSLKPHFFESVYKPFLRSDISNINTAFQYW